MGGYVIVPFGLYELIRGFERRATGEALVGVALIVVGALMIAARLQARRVIREWRQQADDRE